MKKTTVILTGLLLVSLVLSGCQSAPVDGKYAKLAQCLTDKGVKFYGTFWCSFCRQQKSIFGDDLRYIDYVECDERGENGDPLACKAAGVDRFPTWFFPGQGLSTGVMQPEELAKKANCVDALPPDESNAQ